MAKFETLIVPRGLIVTFYLTMVNGWLVLLLTVFDGKIFTKFLKSQMLLTTCGAGMLRAPSVRVPCYHEGNRRTKT